MPKVVWTLDKIHKKCKELNIEFLDNTYKHNIKNNFRCRCGNVFKRLFGNVIKGQTLCADCVKLRDKLRKEKQLLQNYYEFKKYVEEKSNSGCRLLAQPEDYKSNKSKLKMQCSCGNIFFPTANNFKRGHQKCVSCGNAMNSKKLRKKIEEIKALVESCGYILIDYVYDKEHRLIVKCDVEHHKPYSVSYSNFYSGHRCPSCNISRGEKRIEDFLIEHEFEYQKQYTFDNLVGKNNHKLRFDFAITKNNRLILIEYDGEQHYKPKFGEVEFERTKRTDKMKNEYCKNKNIDLIRIPYYEFDNIEQILQEALIHADTERVCQPQTLVEHRG